MKLRIERSSPLKSRQINLTNGQTFKFSQAEMRLDILEGERLVATFGFVHSLIEEDNVEVLGCV